MTGLLAAIQFLSLIRLKKAPFDHAELGRSSLFFPAVGLVFGGLLYILDILALRFLSAGLAALLLVGALALLTRGLHLDGFVDTVDALASGKSAEEILRFLRESTVGALGLAALVFLILAKVMAVADLSHFRVAGLVLAPALSRWAAVYSLSFFPYARTDGRGLVFSHNSGLGQFLGATLIIGIPALYLLGGAAFFIMALVLAVTHYLSSQAKRVLGGLTGDVYGAVIELTEVLILVVLVFMGAAR